jgi:hypothetical protein
VSWLKTDDRIASHPKILKAGPEAAWLWLAAIAYAKNHLTDGFVPHDALPTLAKWSIPVEELARRCVDAKARPDGQGLLEPCEGGHRVHDFLDHNPSREDVSAAMKKARERKADYRSRMATESAKRADRRRRRDAPQDSDCPVDVPTGHPVPDVICPPDKGRTCHDHGHEHVRISDDHTPNGVAVSLIVDQQVSAGVPATLWVDAVGDLDVPSKSRACPTGTRPTHGTYSDSDSPHDQNPDQEHRAVARPAFSTAFGKPPNVAPLPPPSHAHLCALIAAERTARPTLADGDLVEHAKCAAARAGLAYDSQHVWSALDAVLAAERRRQVRARVPRPALAAAAGGCA